MLKKNQEFFTNFLCIPFVYSVASTSILKSSDQNSSCLTFHEPMDIEVPKEAMEYDSHESTWTVSSRRHSSSTLIGRCLLFTWIVYLSIQKEIVLKK